MTTSDRGPRCPRHHLAQDLGALEDPYPLLESVRSSGAVVRVRLYERFDVWWVTGYAAAVAALSATELSSDQRHAHPALACHVSPMRVGLIDKDPPEHTLLRGKTLRAFSGARLAAFEQDARTQGASLVGELPPEHTVDLLPALVGPLVERTVSTFLGLPPVVDSALRAHAEQLTRPMTADAVRTEIGRARAVLRRHVRAGGVAEGGHSEDGQQPPGTGMRGHLPSDEWADIVLQMYVAGRQSTVDFLAGTLLGLLAVEGWAHLCQDASVRLTAVDEFLRLDGPIVRGVWRFARTDLDLAGTAVARGDIVIVSLALAGRDPQVFPDSARLDIHRTPNRHLQFGLGAHRCVGVPLVRSLADALLLALAARFPEARPSPACSGRTARRGSVFRGPARVPIDLGPAYQPAPLDSPTPRRNA
ncbi:cytochrome P450 [Streptomyces sp. KA12]|uniref:cytochrome P450 n=1 Tax=Streptomyces sp. KA12 TaxID=2991730 RepID=UPI0023B10E55|nr:cytochrome P450 [Streptomyces sp. KA12]MDF0374388.1 cytochrome P450 [Streptomyces sp. KA12]